MQLIIFMKKYEIEIAWITHNSFKNNGRNMWQEILTFGKFLLY